MSHQELPTPDLVAFSGQRDYRIMSAGFTRAQMTSEIVEVLINAGWEILSGPTAQSFGDGYFLRSQQSPWYDHENVPAWYVGNKIVLEIDNNGSSADTRLRLGVDYDGTTEHMMTSGQFFILRHGDVDDFPFHILACPYQFAYWTSNDPDAGLATQNNNMQRASFLASAINLPKSMLQLHRIVHCVVATNRLRGYNEGLGGAAQGVDYVCYRTKNDSGDFTGTSLGDDGLRFISPGSGISPGNKSSSRIWNRALDIGMTDENKWSAFYVPPCTIFKIPPNDDTTINGFLWDAIVISEGFRLQTTVSISDRNWIMYGGTNRLSFNRRGASLFLNTDINLPV